MWLVVLASAITQCGASEYFVKPTNFTNDICPGQLCLNRNTNDAAYYIKSNNVSLESMYILLRPIVIRDVENITLMATFGKSNMTIATQFICEHLNRTQDWVELFLSMWMYVAQVLDW